MLIIKINSNKILILHLVPHTHICRNATFEIYNAFPCNIKEIYNVFPCNIKEIYNAFPCNIKEIYNAFPCNIKEIYNAFPCNIKEIYSAFPCNTPSKQAGSWGNMKAALENTRRSRLVSLRCSSVLPTSKYSDEAILKGNKCYDHTACIVP